MGIFVSCANSCTNSWTVSCTNSCTNSSNAWDPARAKGLTEWELGQDWDQGLARPGTRAQQLPLRPWAQAGFQAFVHELVHELVHEFVHEFVRIIPK